MVYISDLMEEATKIIGEEVRKYLKEEKLGNAEAVGISALIINDLKQKTSKNVKVSLENSYHVTSIDTTSLQESIDLELVYHIAHYDVLSISYSNHEPHNLVQYLFVLCNTASKALKELQVKTTPDATTAMAFARLLLFHCKYKEDSW